MEFTIDGFVIAALGILPGFLTSFISCAFSNDQEDMPLEKWVAPSIVASMILNLLVAAVFVTWVIPVPFDTNIRDFIDGIGALPVETLLYYGLALYVTAAVVGVILGLIPAPSPGALAYRWRLTRVSPVQNVFRATLVALFRDKLNIKARGRPDEKIPWIGLRREHVAVLGRLRRSSVKFDNDKPIEVFLSPVRIARGDTVTIVEPPHGLYLRLLAEDVVEVLSVQAGNSLIE